MKEFMNWLKLNSKDAVIAISLVVLLLAALAVFVPQAPLIAIGLIAFAPGWSSYTPSTPPVVDHGYEQWYTFLFYLLHKYESDWTIIPPVEPIHMAPHWPPIIQRGGAEIIRAGLDKKRGCICMSADEFAKGLRRTIDFELARGHGINVPFDSPDGVVPIFYLLDVEETPTAYIVNERQYHAVKRIVEARQQQRHVRRHRPRRPPTTRISKWTV